MWGSLGTCGGCGDTAPPVGRGTYGTNTARREGGGDGGFKRR